MMIKKLSELKLGDVVRLQPEIPNTPFHELTVVQATKEAITFFRHYTHLADFTYSGGVIPYVGTETFQAPISMSHDYLLLTNIFNERKI